MTKNDRQPAGGNDRLAAARNTPGRRTCDLAVQPLQLVAQHQTSISFTRIERIRSSNSSSSRRDDPTEGCGLS